MCYVQSKKPISRRLVSRALAWSGDSGRTGRRGGPISRPRSCINTLPTPACPPLEIRNMLNRQERWRIVGYCFSLTILLQQSDHCLRPSLLLLSSLNIIPTDCCQETVVQLPHVVICTAGSRPHLIQMCSYCHMTHTFQRLKYIPVPMHLEVARIGYMDVMNHLWNVCTEGTSIASCPDLGPLEATIAATEPKFLAYDIPDRSHTTWHIFLHCATHSDSAGEGQCWCIWYPGE